MSKLRSPASPVSVSDESLDVFNVNQVVVGATPVQLDQEGLEARKAIKIKLLSANTGRVYVGPYGVTPTTGFELSPGQELELKVFDLTTIYLVGLNGGNLTGAYLYRYTFVTAAGETNGGAEAAAVNPSSQAVQVTIATGPTGTTARRIYRTAANGAGGTEKLVATINDNTTTQYLDNVPDGSLGASVPGSNGTTMAPPGAPTTAVGAAGALTGAYLYKITFVDATGETNGGTESASVSPSAQEVNLSAIPIGPAGVTARKIYRTTAGGATGTEKLVATISDNTTTTYVDNLPDASLGATVPTVNGTTVAAPAAPTLVAEAALQSVSWIAV